MKILITGATGFLGGAIAAAALREGHAVRAAVRPGAKPEAIARLRGSGIDVVEAALAAQSPLTEALRGIDAVIHAAAAMHGDYVQQHADTVLATRHLLEAMRTAGVARLIGISSFSVYDYGALATGAVLDESAPLERRPARRDVYAQVKLEQEALFHEFGGAVTIFRPGVIIGRERLRPACTGHPLGGRRWLMVGDAILPLTYVDNCADAIVAALARPASIGQTFNIVDDELPLLDIYLNVLENIEGAGKTRIPMPWPLLRALAGIATACNALTGHRLPLPGLLVAARVDARFKPLRYSNARAKDVLGWQPQVGWREALRRSLAA